MDINIRFSLDAPQGWKRRVLLYVGTPLALVTAASALAHAYDTSWIADKQPVSASALKGNLDEIQKRLVALEDPYCGVTAIPAMGNLNGYAGAKSACVSQCNSQTAHMCMSNELVRSASLGKVIPQGWCSTGGAHNEPSGVLVNDCDGWTSTTASKGGATWSQNHPSAQGCNAATPILCCD